jgi:hypothetical protein
LQEREQESQLAPDQTYADVCGRMLTYAYLAGEGTGVAAGAGPAAPALARAVLEHYGAVLAREIRAVGRHLVA